jgi:hypothetical protein
MPGYKPITSNPSAGVHLKFITPRAPSRSVAAMQDPKHTEGEFLSDLDRASSNGAKERLAASKDT